MAHVEVTFPPGGPGLHYKSPRVVHGDGDTSFQSQCFCPPVSCLLYSFPSLLRYKTHAHLSPPSPLFPTPRSRALLVTWPGLTSPPVPTSPASRPTNKMLWTCVALVASLRLPPPPRWTSRCGCQTFGMVDSSSLGTVDSEAVSSCVDPWYQDNLLLITYHLILLHLRNIRRGLCKPRSRIISTLRNDRDEQWS